jgi:hypothetical protein
MCFKAPENRSVIYFTFFQSMGQIDQLDGLHENSKMLLFVLLFVDF